MRIGIDIDGVLADLGTSLCEVIKEKYHVWITKECIFTYDIGYCLGISQEEAREIICEAMLRDVPVIGRAVESVQELSERHRIYIVTNRSGYCPDITTIKWLLRHKIPFDAIYWKEEYEPFDIMIDDWPDKLRTWGKEAKYRFLFTQPWNDRVLDVKNEFIRVFGWEDVLEEIEKIEEGKSGKVKGS